MSQFAPYFYALYNAKSLQEFKAKKKLTAKEFPALGDSLAFINLCKQSNHWGRYYTRGIFTIDIKTTSRSESMNANLKQICKRIRRNYDTKILMAFDEILQKETYSQEYRTKKQNNKAANPSVMAFSKFYTDFCMIHIESAIEKMECCSIKHIGKSKGNNFRK